MIILIRNSLISLDEIVCDFEEDQRVRVGVSNRQYPEEKVTEQAKSTTDNNGAHFWLLAYV